MNMSPSLNFSIAVKSFIVDKSNKILLIKRRDNDVHSPGAWEIPGGRLSVGEDPFEGLKRETREETGIGIDIVVPLNIHHFTRDDRQEITMIVFLCKPLSNMIKLSEEHTDHGWYGIAEAKKKIVPAFRKEIDLYQKYFMKKDI